MKRNHMPAEKLPERPPLSLAERSGLVALAASGGLFFFDYRVGVLPLAVFFLLCLAAPFLPRFGFYLPIISRGRTGRMAVSITFDDGPDPATTPELLALLSEYRFKATFFVAGEKAAAHPDIIREIVRQGHTIGNHTYSHDPFIMLKGGRRLFGEIEATQTVLRRLGIIALTFRPPVGITGPQLPFVLFRLRLLMVNFSCRAYDGGNRRVRHLAARILKRVKADDIILLHDVEPRSLERLASWKSEIRLIFAGLHQQGLAVLPLAELIGRPVMDVIIEK